MRQSNDQKTLKKTNFLVSLKKLDELSDEVITKIDILDLKNPSKGSIGAWNLFEIKKAIFLFKDKIKISATLGDIFENEDFINKLEKFDDLNLDFIKFGLLSSDSKNLFDKIDILSSRVYKTNLVCVVFVDIKDNLKLVNNNLEFFIKSGLRHLMLDTYKKDNGNLLKFCKINYLQKFINKSRKLGIKVGLAGGLSEQQVPMIMDIKPNIIGFRSAVCKLNKRTSSIDLNKIKKISRHFNSCNNNAMERAGA